MATCQSPQRPTDSAKEPNLQKLLMGETPMSSFNKTLIDLLKTDYRFIDKSGELFEQEIKKRAWALDKNLVGLLVSNPKIKNKFFNEIQNHWILM